MKTILEAAGPVPCASLLPVTSAPQYVHRLRRWMFVLFQCANSKGCRPPYQYNRA